MKRKFLHLLAAALAITFLAAPAAIAKNADTKADLSTHAAAMTVNGLEFLTSTEGARFGEPVTMVAGAQNETIPGANMISADLIAQDASQMNSGSGANLVILAANTASSGGSSFHVGKFVASMNGESVDETVANCAA